MSTRSISGRNSLFFGSLFYFFFACSGGQKPAQTNPADSVQVAAGTTTTRSKTAITDKPVSEKQVTIGQTTWVYENRMDTEEGTTHKASITSPTRLQFGFPYEGGSSTTLVIRKKDNETATVYLQVSRGQFNKSFQGGNARITFDEKAPETYVYSAAANGSATVIFFDAAGTLIRKLKKAQNTTINVTFSNQGNRKIEFRTAGLRWKY